MGNRHFQYGFGVTLTCFVLANLIAVHVQSDCGLLEGLGIVDQANDDVRRAGFPFLFFEEGGIAHRRTFRPSSFLLDIGIAFGGSMAIGFAFNWFRKSSTKRDFHPV